MMFINFLLSSMDLKFSVARMSVVRLQSVAAFDSLWNPVAPD
jgi:hypothetical protein